ncbi:peptidylprolyl isomerase [Myxococcota bacterium]
MLDFFRRGGGIAQLVIGAVVVMIIVVFVVEFRQGGRAQGRVSLECALKVHGYCVDTKEYQAAQALVVPPGADPKWIRQQRLDRYVMEGLIERELLHAEADRTGLNLGEKELNDELELGRMRVSLPVNQARSLSGRLGLCRVTDSRNPQCVPGTDLGVRLLRVKSSKTDRFDYKIYERTIRIATNRSAREFKEMQHRELVADRIRQLVRQRIRVSDGEAFLVYRREHTQATARIVQLRRGWFARHAVGSSDRLVNDWASANEDPIKEVWDKEKEDYTAGCSLVSEIFLARKAPVTDEEQENVKSKVTQAAERLAAGEDFALVARQLSERDSAVVGGEAGCFQPKRYGDEDGKKLAEALQGMDPGTVTPVIETERGYYLFRLQGALVPGEEEETGRRAIARRLFVRFRADGLVTQFAEELLAKVKAGARLEEATSQLVTEYLAEGPTSTARRTGILRSKPGAPGSAPAMPALGKKPAASGPVPDADAVDSPRVDETRPFTIVGTPILGAKPSSQAAAKLFELKSGQLLEAPIETYDGLAVAELKGKTLAKREAFEQTKRELIARMEDLKADDALANYVARLRAAAGERIEIDPKMLEESQKENQTGNAPDEE